MSGPLFPAWLQAEVLQVWCPFALSRVGGHETPKRTLSARDHSAHGDDRKAPWVPCASMSSRSKRAREQATTESPPHRAQKNNLGPIATAESWDLVADTLRQKLPSGPGFPPLPHENRRFTPELGPLPETRPSRPGHPADWLQVQFPTWLGTSCPGAVRRGRHLQPL